MRVRWRPRQAKVRRDRARSWRGIRLRLVSSSGESLGAGFRVLGTRQEIAAFTSSATFFSTVGLHF